MAETKVILTKSVNHLGHPGDVVSVKAGYARNYLIGQCRFVFPFFQLKKSYQRK